MLRLILLLLAGLVEMPMIFARTIACIIIKTTIIITGSGSLNLPYYYNWKSYNSQVIEREYSFEIPFMEPKEINNNRFNRIKPYIWLLYGAKRINLSIVEPMLIFPISKEIAQPVKKVGKKENIIISEPAKQKFKHRLNKWEVKDARHLKNKMKGIKRRNNSKNIYKINGCSVKEQTKIVNQIKRLRAITKGENISDEILFSCWEEISNLLNKIEEMNPSHFILKV